MRRINQQASPEASAMFGWLKLILQVGVVCVGLTACSCFAAGTLMNANAEEESHEQSWNREQKSNTRQDARAIVQQKAQARAEQRNDRLATSAWYGMWNSGRPTSSTPWGSRYGSQWEMPGGRPNSWY